MLFISGQIWLSLFYFQLYLIRLCGLPIFMRFLTIHTYIFRLYVDSSDLCAFKSSNFLFCHSNFLLVHFAKPIESDKTLLISKVWVHNFTLLFFISLFLCLCHVAQVEKLILNNLWSVVRRFVHVFVCSKSISRAKFTGVQLKVFLFRG